MAVKLLARYCRASRGGDAGDVTRMFESLGKSHPKCKAPFAEYVNDICSWNVYVKGNRTWGVIWAGVKCSEYIWHYLHVSLLSVFFWCVLPHFSVCAHMMDSPKTLRWMSDLVISVASRAFFGKQKQKSILCVLVRLLLKRFCTRQFISFSSQKESQMETSYCH